MALQEVTESGCAYLKAGFYGAQGSGKTRTATELALHLHKRIGSSKPIAFIDSESGSDFIVPLLREQGVRVLVDKTRAFADLARDMQDAARGAADILIVDSVTHFWREIMRAYLTKRRQRFLRIQDWGPLKQEWESKYTRPYLDLPLHIIMCGRSANIFEDVEDEDATADSSDGKPKWKANKVGTKMSAEGETGYEPHLLVEMERVYEDGTGRYARRATVVKERFGILDGHQFVFSAKDKPGYVLECFRPHIEKLALGGQHRSLRDSNSTELFDSHGQTGGVAIAQRRAIALEELEGIVTRWMPGSSPKDRALKAAVYEATFGTTSWTALQSWPPDALGDIQPLLAHLLQIASESPPEGSPAEVLAAFVRHREAFLILQATRRPAQAPATSDASPPPDGSAELVVQEDDLPLFTSDSRN